MPIFQYKPLRYEILKHRDSPSLTCLELLIRANYPDRGGYLSTMKLEEFRFELPEELIAYLFYACPIERASVFLLHLLHSNKRKMKVMQPVPGKCHPHPMAPGIKRFLVCSSSKMVGVRGFEPRTSSSRTKRASQLRYTPEGINSECLMKPFCGTSK